MKYFLQRKRQSSAVWKRICLDKRSQGSRRLHQHRSRKAALKEWEPDFVGVENIQLQRYGEKYTDVQVKTFQTLANLQGVLFDTIFEACIDSDLVRSSEWRSYCGINDGDSHRDAKKKQAQAKVKIWYDINCSEDEADAICIGKYFCGKLKKSSWGEEI